MLLYDWCKLLILRQLLNDLLWHSIIETPKSLVDRGKVGANQIYQLRQSISEPQAGLYSRVVGHLMSMGLVTLVEGVMEERVLPDVEILGYHCQRWVHPAGMLSEGKA